MSYDFIIVGAGSADADYALAEALSLSARDPSRALPGIRAALRDGASPGANAAGQVLAIAFEALAPGAREGTSSQTRSCALLLGAGVLTRACLSGLQSASATYPVAACPAAAFCPSSGNW